MTIDSAKNSKRKGINFTYGDREILTENKKRKSSCSTSTRDSNVRPDSTQLRSKKNESCMDIFVQANDNDEKELIKLDTIEIKNLKDGFKYLGYRCRVVVSRQKVKEPKNNLPDAFNWVEGIIKYWDPKFKLFFIHFLLSPSMNSFSNQNNISKHEWKYLATQNNSPPAMTELSNLVLSPFAIDRGWFDPNPITLRVYGNSPVIDLSSILFENRLEQTKYKESNNEICTRCKLSIVKDLSQSCEICSRKFHSSCVTEGKSDIQDLKDLDITSLRRYNSPSNLELLVIANEHNQYIRERRKLWKRNKDIYDKEGNLSLNNKFFHGNQLPYDLVDVEELEKALPAEVKNVILENYNMSHTGIRKLLSKLPNKIGCIIGDHQVKLLCRNYRYNGRNKSTILTKSFKEEEDLSKNTSLELPPSKIYSTDELTVQKSDLIDDINLNLNLTKNESNFELPIIETRELDYTDLANSRNNSIQILVGAGLNNGLAQKNECKYRCKECMPCIYCKEPLIRVPMILKPNELPNRSVVYSQIPTKLENFVVCSTCGICYHGSCGNSFIPPLIFGGNNFNCSNCCKCIHCGYRDDGFMDYASWDSTFSSCIRCCKGFERGQFCSICRKIWTSSWEGEWLQCDICKFWVHYDCDKGLSKPMEFYSNVNNCYNCPACRSNDNSVKYKRILEHFICLDKNKDFVSIPLPSYQNYWKVVKIPMDIITITKNLENKKYESDDYSFIKDIFRILYNAQISHMPNHRIFKLAANILKKITHLFRLLFGENILFNFFRMVKDEESSMSILLDQVNGDNSKSKIDGEVLENTNSFKSLEHSSGYKINYLENEDKYENEFAAILTNNVCMSDRMKLNTEINWSLRKTISREKFVYLEEYDCLNSAFGKLMIEFQKCIICQQKSGHLVQCLKCGLGVHTKCSEEANSSFICNSCTTCNICSELMIEASIPVISCHTCTKRAHYTCIWQDYEEFISQSKYSGVSSRMSKRNEGRHTFINLSRALKDNRNYICLWKIFSSASSPNKPRVLISSPLTAVFGKGYYQYLINEIYLCTECFEAKTYLHSNLFMKKYADEYNRFLFDKVNNFQKLIKEILNKDYSEKHSNEEGTKQKEINRILKKISNVKLKPFMHCEQKNVIICNLCSERFFCEDFEDLADIANDKLICSVHLNFICNNCSSFGTKHSRNRDNKINDFDVQNFDTKVEENSKKSKSQVNVFPLILNTLISTSQFRMTLSKDIYLLLKIILRPFIDQKILEVIEKYNSYLDADIEKIRNEIFIKYSNSELFAKLISQTLNSSLLQWYLFYIHQSGSLDLSRLRKNYLQHFYRRNNISLDDLIKSNTLYIIIGSIEKMVLSNEISSTTDQNKSIQNSLNDPDYLSFLGLYSNLLFLRGNFHLFGLGSLNTMNCQAIVDTKMYFDVNDSFKKYLLNNQNSRKNSISVTKQRALKNEIIQGLTLIKNQIEKDRKDFELPKLSFFVLIYNLILTKLNKIDNCLDNIYSNKCRYCGKTQNILLGDYFIIVGENINLHKECVLWSLPFVLEPILNHLDMGYESKFETNKKKSDIYTPKYQTFENISWPIIRRPIRVDINDIILTLNDLDVLKCFFCGQTGATIKCSGNDTCFKYYHIDCIFGNFQYVYLNSHSNSQFNKECGKVINNSVSNINLVEQSIVHIRLKYRRVWCKECWEIYKSMIEPEPSFSEGLTGGILNTFVSMLSVDIIIATNTTIQEKMQTVNKNKVFDLFLEQLISITSGLEKRSCSKVKILIQRLKRIRDSISFKNFEFEPNILNNSIILLDPGVIIDNKNLLNEKKTILFPTNYRSLRIWKSSGIINSIFKIDNYLSLYLCSIFEVNGDLEFQIDWVPSSLDEVKKVKELLNTKGNIRDEELLREIHINGILHRLFCIPLLRDSNLKNLFNSFSELLSSSSLKDISRYTLQCIIYPEYFTDDSFLDHINTKESPMVSDCDTQSQIFFGFREEFIYNFIKREIDKFCLFELISAFYSKKIFADIIHPELWSSHRQHPYSRKLSNYEGFDFEYSKLGRNTLRGSRIDEELFNVLYDGNNQDPGNVELMNSTHQNLQESSRRSRIKLEDMAPSKLYRYLDSLPYDKRLSIKKSSIHGFGLFAKELIKAGEPIIEYVGEVIRNSVADKRENFYKSDGNRDGSCYMFRLDESSVIDATNTGNHARFMNHCCDPNSICKVISIDPHNKHIVIFSKKTIDKDEEITYDYQFNVEEASEKIICHCGVSNCLGRMN
ncbi:chromatinic protein [Cryptosporidium ubiquitum]|uniref:[histone H3]-lysine(4) N-trimethyltransferase n=1 Tax=Cryptosporidium ubiquitum TaxID=857276 RepID=A0A1J4MJR3_9CRYT|nr:chromatinic protein [Cryptosporidium ubiquitum]OII73699.1 chromatinic protein [Cryptosporidium ubiquitum]